MTTTPAFKSSLITVEPCDTAMFAVIISSDYPIGDEIETRHTLLFFRTEEEAVAMGIKMTESSQHVKSRACYSIAPLTLSTWYTLPASIRSNDSCIKAIYLSK